MIRIAIAALLFAGGIAGASAQDFTAEQRAACSGDYNKFCKGTMPGGGRILACLNKNNAQLTPACQKAVAAAKK